MLQDTCQNGCGTNFTNTKGAMNRHSDIIAPMEFATKITLEMISEHLIRAIGETLTPNSSASQWTKTVKNVLAHLGRNQLGYMPCASGCDCSEQGEWLLDLIWMDKASWAIMLAVESEWGNKAAIMEDFGKLLCIKAPHKMMLINTASHKSSDDIRNTLATMLRGYPYHVSGEEYLLLECTDAGAYRYLFRVSSDGSVSNPQWQEVPDSPVQWNWRTTAKT